MKSPTCNDEVAHTNHWSFEHTTTTHFVDDNLSQVSIDRAVADYE